MSQRGGRGRGRGSDDLSHDMRRMDVGGGQGRGGPPRGGQRGGGGDRGGRGGGGEYRGGHGGGGDYRRDDYSRGGGERGGGGRGASGYEGRGGRGYEGGRGGGGRGFDGGRGGGGRGFDGGRGGRGFDRGGRGGGGGRGRRTIVEFQQRVHPSEKPPIAGPLGWAPFVEGGDNELPKRKENSGAKNSEQTSQIVLNHFPVMFNAKSLPKSIYKYHVDIERVKKKVETKPGQEPKKGKGKKPLQRPQPGPGGDGEVKLLPKEHRKQILLYLITRWRNSHPDYGFITDFSTDVYCVKPVERAGIDMVLELSGAELQKYFPDEQEATFRVTIRSTGETIDIDQLRCDLNNMRGVPVSPILIGLDRVYGILIRCVKLNAYTPMKRSDLIDFSHPPHQLGGGICSYEGFNVMLPISNGWKKFINIEIANLASYLGGPVLDVLDNLFDGRVDPTNVTRWRRDDFIKATELLRTCKILYSPQANRTFSKVVDEVCPKSVSETMFDINGRQISVYDYFRVTYNLPLKFRDGPLLKCKGANSPKIPVEICRLKDGQSYNRKLNENQTTKMAEVARQSPDALHNLISQAVKKLDLNNNPAFGPYGLTLANQGQMHQVNARVLAPPDLMYGEKKNGQDPGKRAIITPENGEWDIWQNNVEFRFFSSENIKCWGVINTTNPRYRGVTDDQAWEFAEKLIVKAATKGIQIPDPLAVESLDLQDFAERRDENVEKLRPLLEKFKRAFKGVKQAFVLVIVSKKGCQVYNHVKQAAELEVGILTQCVTAQSMTAFGGRGESVLGNILLKINSKLGSVNHVVMEPPKLPNSFPVFKYPVMIMGADVTHPPPGSSFLRKGKDGKMLEIGPPSFAAVTASIDRTGMPYMMHIEAQEKAGKGAAEVIQRLQAIVVKFIQRFVNETKGIRPYKIIYFRDGVGDGQFQEVLRTEMSAIRKACGSFGEKYEPKITFITVQKRHKTRFFLKEGNNILNAKPGTVVDTDIVHPLETDFYLLSHQGLLGTSRPTRYHVLWDDSDYSMNEIQTLAYFLCYMFVRCNRSVKIPAPTYYSHWAAKRAEILSKGWGERYYGDINGLNAELMKRENLDCGKHYPMHFV